jgi:hypothetical protein
VSDGREIGSRVGDYKYDFNMRVSVGDIAGHDHSVGQCGAHHLDRDAG